MTKILNHCMVIIKSIKLISEDPTYLLIYLNVNYHQRVRRKMRGDDDQYEIFGCTVFPQWLLEHNLKKEEYQLSYS